MTEELPDPRDDGVCAVCERRMAVSKDGRFCSPCLKKYVARLNPMTGCYRGVYRTRDHKQDSESEPSPWQENAVRGLEDS